MATKTKTRIEKRGVGRPSKPGERHMVRIPVPLKGRIDAFRAAQLGTTGEIPNFSDAVNLLICNGLQQSGK